MLSKADERLKQDVLTMIEGKDYIPNSFTDMIKDIVNKDTWTEKQRNALLLHLQIFWDKKVK